MSPWTVLLPVAAAMFLSGCGQTVDGPTAIAMQDRHWWQIFGDTVKPGEDPLEGRFLTRDDQELQRSKWHVRRSEQLHIAIPDQTVSSAILRAYTKQTGVGFKIFIFDSEEEFYQLLAGSSLDVALVPMQLAEELVQRRLLAQLDHGSLPRLKDLEWPRPIFKYFTRDLPIDPGNNYVVPYLFGSIGIAYDRTYLPHGVPSFKMLHHPELLAPDELTNVVGRIALSSNRRTALAGALLALGENINTTNTAAIERAGNELLRLRPYLHKNTRTNPVDRLEWARRLAHREVSLAQANSANAALAMTLNPGIDFVTPSEGAILTLDSFVIPTGGKRSASQHFINYMLEPVVAGTFAGLSYCASTSQEAKSFIPREILKGPAYKIHNKAQVPLVLRAGNLNVKKLDRYFFEQLLNL